MRAPPAWSVDRLDVICALTGDKVIEVQTDCQTRAAVYAAVNSALGGDFYFRLVDGTRNVLDLTIAEIRSSLQLVKVRRKGLHTYGPHSILSEMRSMSGSGNCQQYSETLPFSAFNQSQGGKGSAATTRRHRGSVPVTKAVKHGAAAAIDSLLTQGREVEAGRRTAPKTYL